MKQYILTTFLTLALFQLKSIAQEPLAPDQNPRYEASRAKYMQSADSINKLHGTTVQETYKAFDWYENKMENRRERQQFRRDLRMARATRPYGYGYPNQYRNRNYNRNFYNRDYYSPYRYDRPYRNNWFFWWF